MTKEEAIERLKQNKAAAKFYAGMVQNTNAIENELKDIEAIDMAIDALSADAARCKECEVKAYTEKLVDAFIEDGEELADSVKVVRCKDCKHRDEKCGMGEHRWCKILKMSTVPNDFCSYAERREP